MPTWFWSTCVGSSVVCALLIWLAIRPMRFDEEKLTRFAEKRPEFYLESMRRLELLKKALDDGYFDDVDSEKLRREIENFELLSHLNMSRKK